jgi:hypothetical protein
MGTSSAWRAGFDNPLSEPLDAYLQDVQRSLAPRIPGAVAGLPDTLTGVGGAVYDGVGRRGRCRRAR